MKWTWSLLILCVALLTALSACAGLTEAPTGDVASEDVVSSSGSSTEPDHVRVVVTVDFGAETLVDAVLPFQSGMTALDALQQVAEVQTAYGGGFVEDINGIASEGTASAAGRRDWFYYVNGFLARSSSAQYVLRSGDVEQWDYHGWSAGQSVSATLHILPAAFASGYNGNVTPTVVAFDEQFADEATDLASTLVKAGVSDVHTSPLVDLTLEDKQDRNVIVVAAASAPCVQELNGQSDNIGLFARFDGFVLNTFTVSGAKVETHEDGVGLIAAMQSPWNPSGMGACENVLLLVTGTDCDGVKAAVDALVTLDGNAACWPAAVVEDGLLKQIPTTVPAP